MAAKIDYNALKARTMGSGDDEEAVTVNTRALIDKVLARYSGEWTVLRELLQNAADASATRVKVAFETIPSTTVPLPNSADQSASIKHTLTNHTLKRLLVSNNGQPFSSKDWSRLKRIAEGNPDETKIGAFGVGFYSVFADCEEPFVSSGSEAIAFYWKGNSLFTRRLQLDKADSSPDTNFVLDYRNTTSQVPALLPLCQFLASSLTFVGLETIELWLDDWNVLKLQKKTAPKVDVSIPRSVETKTTEGLMKVSGVTGVVAQVDATWMGIVDWKPTSNAFSIGAMRNHDATASLKSFFSRITGSHSNASSDDISKSSKSGRKSPDDDLIRTTTSSVFLHISTATIQTSVSADFSRELERATKKPPPRSTTIAVLTSSYQGNAPSPSEIFASVLPSKSGRIFIGFPTHQTTGLNAHISAPSVIPTVERESIDLNARWVRTWNLELLRAAGIICRVAWSAQMSSIGSRVPGNPVAAGVKARKADISGIITEAIHTANQFSFREATPSSEVGQIIENAFWTCGKDASIDVLSTCGVMSSKHVRLSPKDLSFMDGIPVLPEELTSWAKPFVTRLIDIGLVSEVTISDIKKELESNALTSQQLSEFIAWAGRKCTSGEIAKATIQDLFRVSVANDETSDGTPGRLLILGDIDSFITPSIIPTHLPVPPSTLPFKYTRTMGKNNLEAIGWQELQILPWVRWLIEKSHNRDIFPPEKDLTQSPAFAAQVLPVLSKQWDGLPSKSSVIELLQNHTVIPTKLGMKKPSETYFPSVRLFDDLPIVTVNGVKEKFLAALGVRKTVDLEVIFERLLDDKDSGSRSIGDKKWSHVELIKYLTSVREDIPSSDIKKLKTAKICTAETLGNAKGGNQRFSVSDLYEPHDSLRGLGLPLLSWPGTYLPSSREAKFLTMLGLKGSPTTEELIRVMAESASKKDFVLHGKAMSYFIQHHHTQGYASFNISKVTTPFLPIEGSDKLSVPSRCFTHIGATLFGFSVLRKDLHVHAAKFGVSDHPPMGDCIGLMLNNPPSVHDARILFGYFAGRMGELNKTQQDLIGRSKIVPVGQNNLRSNVNSSGKAPLTRYTAPNDCYIGDSPDFGDIFDFVDFGRDANAFLYACGSKQEPTKVEVAWVLVKEPARISSNFQDPEKYLNLLRSLSDNILFLKRNKELFKEMKKAPFLLASRELPPQQTKGKAKIEDLDADDQFYEQDRGVKEWLLTSAKDAIIVDDYRSFNLFKESVLAAPQEESLETFYGMLGSQSMSHIVEKQAKWGPLDPNQQLARRLQKQIYERSRLFLHDHPSDIIKHDGKWLEKNLTVQVVQHMSLRLSLKGRRESHLEKRNAILTEKEGNCVLHIAPGKLDLYEISQSLVSLILLRPKLHSTLTLEMLLKSDLYELRTRGYNVERILRQKAAEAKMAESRRQQQLDEEKRRLREMEEDQKRLGEQGVNEDQSGPETNGNMPGHFPNSPSDSKVVLHDKADEPRGHGSRHRGLFSGLTKRFHNRSSSEQPPPYTSEDPRPKSADGPKPIIAPHQLNSSLNSAVKSCRPHGSSSVYSRGETNNVVETKTYCDERPSHDLVDVPGSAGGLRIFFSRSVKNPSEFLTQHEHAFKMFGSVLNLCAEVFALRTDCVSIFHDPEAKTIAFNSKGSIFCNYRFFQELHEAKLLADEKDKSDAIVYWWVIFCHELAHNLVGDHGSNHSYYSEGFVTQYFPKVAQLCAKYSK
ncbi:hypothetical protein FQN54_008625 [Arachnomyces sp. PD_36]|nr:hypothetical protein FQN54_008625 [Arachnomyces sp. PD_36]